MNLMELMSPEEMNEIRETIRARMSPQERDEFDRHYQAEVALASPPRDELKAAIEEAEAVADAAAELAIMAQHGLAGLKARHAREREQDFAMCMLPMPTETVN